MRTNAIDTTNHCRVFIGSSGGRRYIAEALSQFLSSDSIRAYGWWTAFQPGVTTIENLEFICDNHDFAIFVFYPEDELKIKDKSFRSVRDNVLFEAGLFIAKLGRQRVFLLFPKFPGDQDYDAHIPTDLGGITTVLFNAFEEHTSPSERQERLQGAINCIRWEIERQGRRPSLPEHISFGERHEKLLENVHSMLKSLTESGPDTRPIGTFPDFFRDYVPGLLKQASETIWIACDLPAFASFSEPEAFREYFKVLREKARSNINVRFIVLDAARRDEITRLQFGDERVWDRLRLDSEFRDKLFKYADDDDYSFDELIESRDLFLASRNQQQDKMLRKFNQINVEVKAVNIAMPLYLWCIDSSRAIFAIPDHDQIYNLDDMLNRKLEYAFETTNPGLIQALQHIWKSYARYPSDNAYSH